LAPGTRVYITALPSVPLEASIDAAIGLRRAGLEPVPHVGARYIAGRGALDAFLGRLANDAGVTQALLIGGDVARPAGPFASSLDLLRTGALRKAGIRRLGLAAYPEAHPRIARDALEAALAAKIARARDDDISVYAVTQFCFAPEPIRGWLQRFAARHGDVPVHVGLPGPATVATLVRYGVACGIGASLGALRRSTGLGRLLAEADPDATIAALTCDAQAAACIAQLHFFTFGGVRRTTEWLRAFTSEAAAAH
ncbi:MAG: hypothetical protein ACREFQ_10730, partial [Stellaceae bacterium]